MCRELELLKQQKNSEYDEELDDLRATKRNLERKVMNLNFDMMEPFPNFKVLYIVQPNMLLMYSTSCTSVCTVYHYYTSMYHMQL